MIVFDASIYEKAAVKRACADYRELADIRMTEQNGSFRCEIRNPKGDPQLIANEFGNYVLNLTVMMEDTAD